MRKFTFSFKSLLVACLLMGGASSAWGAPSSFLSTWTGQVGTNANDLNFGYGSKKFKVAAGETYEFTLVNFNKKNNDNPWENWVVEGNLGSKYFDCEARGHHWGDPDPVYTPVIEVSDVDNFETAYNGATVTVTISRNVAGTAYTVTHTSDVLGTAVGKTDKYYGGTFTVAVGAEEDWDIYLTQEYSHFVITNVVYTEADGVTTHTYGSAIEALPFSRTWNADNIKYPFDAGTIETGTNVTALNVNNTIATAWFDTDGNKAPYTIAANEEVTVSFTAYHGWLSGGANQGVKLLNSEGNVIAEYIYYLGNGDNLGKLTGINIGGVAATEWSAPFECRSRYNNTKNANGFTGNGNPYQTLDGYNPIFTFKIKGNGEVSVNVNFSNRYVGSSTSSLNVTFTGTLPGVWKGDIQKIQVYSGSNNDDRTIAINNLNVTSEIISSPTITVSSPATYVKKDATHTLTANVVSSETPTFQWYSNTVNSTEGAVAIPSATDATYSPSTNTLGTTYYYAVATNWVGSTISNIVPVVVSDYQTEFSADANSVAKSVAYNTADEELTSTNVTISGGSMYVSNYKTGDPQQVITSGGKFTTNGNATFFKVVLDEALQAGDIISASVGNKNGYGISIYAEYSTSGKPSTTNHADLATTKDDFETHSYTVKESDTYLIGKKTFYIYRLTSNGTYFDNLTISRPNSVSGKIGATGWSSFSTNYKLDLSTISGASAAAYYASSKDGSNVNLASTTAIVNAGEGLMIKGTPGETFTIGKTSSATTFGETNLLFGCPTATEITAEMIESNDYYVVANNSGTAEFQKLAIAITIPAGKAYLQVVKGGAKALNILFEDETATGVEAPVVVEAAEEDGVYYNLNGQVVTKDYKGIVIKNGKKFFNK